MKAFYLMAAILMLASCNQQQATRTAIAVGKSYNTSYRDDVIKNWQSKVSDTERCAQFKARFKAAGERYESAASGAFVEDMMSVWKDTQAAGCQYSP
jgi:uncharacterized lipoprotein YajG